MAAKPRAKMPIEERAKQFSPFAALKELPAALAAKEKILVDKPLLSEDVCEELNRKIKLLKPGAIATVIYYQNGEYIKRTGMVAHVWETSRLLQIVNTKIPFDDILELQFPAPGADPTGNPN